MKVSVDVYIGGVIFSMMTVTCYSIVCTGNHMDESVISENNCKVTGKLHEVKLSAISTVVSTILFPKSHSRPCDYLLIDKSYLH